MRSAAVAALTVAALAAPAYVAAAPASAAAAPNIAATVQAARTAQAAGTITVQQPLNVAADRVALSAYATYLGAVLNGAWLGQENDTTYISTISGLAGCKGALAQLAESKNQVNATVQATLTVLGKELGDDLSITFDQPALAPFSKLSTSLSRLHWTRLSGGVAIVKRFVTTEANVLHVPASPLCQDALLAASDPQTTPPGTKTFVRAYAKASYAANTALANLLKLMQTYQTASERPLLLRISTLAEQITRLTQSDLSTSSSALTAVLQTS
jgi:hypothetical protein